MIVMIVIMWKKNNKTVDIRVIRKKLLRLSMIQDPVQYSVKISKVFLMELKTLFSSLEMMMVMKKKKLFKKHHSAAN